MAKVFICYRRADSAASSGRIYDRLIARFGKRNVFKDVDNIPVGVRFTDYIRDSLRQCAVALVIIGRDWLSARTEDGVRRLDDPADFVRVEIETAFTLGLAVIPVLVEGASVPSASSLPESLRELPAINAVEVRNDPDFTRDMERVVAALERALARPRRAPTAPRAGTPPPPAPELPQVPPSSTIELEAGMSPSTAPAHGAMTPQPRRGRGRRALLGTLAALLVVGSLGALILTQNAASSAANAMGTETARTQATGTAGAKVATANASATAQQQVFAQETQTAVAMQVRFPYRAAAPGPLCDTDNAPWTLGNGTTQSAVQCFSNHTRITSGGIMWSAPPNNPFPQSYTVSVQVSNMTTNAAATLTVWKGDVADLTYYAWGLESSVYCPAPGSPGCTGNTYNGNPAGVHTLTISVNGTRITYVVDGRTLDSHTETSASATQFISLTVAYPQTGSTQAASADFSNFSIG